MKLVGWMTAGSVLSAALLTLLPGVGDETEVWLGVWLGMTGPLAVASVGWIAIERAYERDPRSLTALQVWLFVGKMVFIAGYVVAILGATPARPTPFAAAFTGYFLALYAAEATALHRLLQRPRLNND